VEDNASKELEGKNSTSPWPIVVVVVVVVISLAGYLALRLTSRDPILPTAATPTAQPQPSAQPVNREAAITGDAAPVLVEFSLDNSYPDAERPLIDAALQVLPARDVTIQAPMPVADLIGRQFGVNAERQAGLYARLAAEIQRRSEMVNGLLAPGTARVPQLPPFTNSRNNFSAFIRLRTGRDRSDPTVPRLATGDFFRPTSALQPALTTYTVSS
jgi:hypothetical protein